MFEKMKENVDRIIAEKTKTANIMWVSKASHNVLA